MITLEPLNPAALLPVSTLPVYTEPPLWVPSKVVENLKSCVSFELPLCQIVYVEPTKNSNVGCLTSSIKYLLPSSVDCTSTTNVVSSTNGS